MFSLVSAYAGAQQVVTQAGIEKTVARLEYGVSVSYETKRLWALGSFYQTNLNLNHAEGTLTEKNFFYGILLQAPIAKSERLAFLLNLRSGFINDKFFVVVPSLETRVHVSNRVGVSIGTALRMGYPALSAKVFLKLF
jgi:hypothetical protein